MLNYNELRAALKEAKNTANREIAAIIVQAEKPLTAREIADALDSDESGITGISAQSVANLIVRGEVRSYAGALGYAVDKKNAKETKLYVNPDDPTDVISITRHRNVYIPRKH